MITQQGSIYSLITPDLFEQVMGPKQKTKKGRKYQCPVCNEINVSFWHLGRDWNCFSCLKKGDIAQEILKRAGLWQEKKTSDRSTKTAKVQVRTLDEKLKNELAQSWRPGPDPELEKGNLATYPRDIVWKLNFSTISGLETIRDFLGNYYCGTPQGWISTMGSGGPSQNQFKPEVPVEYLDKKQAKNCLFWAAIYKEYGLIPGGWRQYLNTKTAKYLTSKKGYNALIPRVPYTTDHWERLKADKTIPLEITEGAKKTASNMFVLGISTIGVVGVSMWRSKGSDELLHRIKELVRDRQDYTIKFDADFHRKPGVLREIIHHGLAAQSVGATVFVAIWDESFGKGIDDVIASGKDAGYGAGIVEKIPFDEFLVRYPLPQEQEMRETFNGFAAKLKANFRKACKKASDRFLNSIEKQVAQKQNVSQKTIIYRPGHLLDDVTKTPDAIIEYTASDRLTIWQEMTRIKSKYNLDLSFTGSGKSHVAGNIIPEKMGLHQVIYLHSQHANAATATLGKWDDLPPRHSGLVTGKRKNPDGSHHKSWPKDGQVADIAPNCKWASVFTDGIIKNVGHEELKAICNNCEFGKKEDEDKKSHPCASDEGVGFGYKSQRISTLSSPRLRANLTSLPLDEEYFAESLLFWDEFSSEVTGCRTFAVDLNTIKLDFVDLEIKNPVLFDAIAPVRRALLEVSEMDLPRYGFSDRELRDNLRQKISASNPTIFEEGSEWAKQMQSAVAKVFAVNIEQQIKAKGGIDKVDMRLQWLPDFLRTLTDEAYGAFTFNGSLHLSISDDRARFVAKAAKVNVFADATAEPGTVCQVLGIERHQLIVVREKTPDHSNLSVISVDFERHIPKGDRSKELESRLAAAHTALKEKYGGKLITFNYKSNAEDGDLVLFADNRGINHASNKSALVTIGDPYLHRGALAVRFQAIVKRSPALDGTDAEFEAYYLQACNAEIIQMVGRLRAARREEAIAYYHFGNLDMTFLTAILPGVSVSKIMAQEITPNAAPKDIRFKVDLIEAAIESIKEGFEVTQEILAEKLAISQGAISKLAKRISGGWWFLKALFQSLLDIFSRERNNSEKSLEALSVEEREWLDGFLSPSLIAAFAEGSVPDEDFLVTTCDLMFEAFKPGRVLAIFKNVNSENQLNLLQYLAKMAHIDLKDLSPHLHFV